ncbi:MAG: phosphoribosyltransferase [bacterium]|nr:phosphoribosyltransferase [bacterium]MCP4965027.1 phosphoribosyltransferase [bacterium]
MRYVDRTEAGYRIAADVAAVLPQPKGDVQEPIFLGIPRGGVIVAAALAAALSAELEVALARKIGAPHNPELAIGAVGETGDAIFDTALVERLGVAGDYLERATDRERFELQRRLVRYRGDRPPPDIGGRVVAVVDDGIATGATLRATLGSIRAQRPKWLGCVVPVGPADSVRRIADEVDAMVCPLQPKWFWAVGEWYESFSQTTDEEVVTVLTEAWSRW